MKKKLIGVLLAATLLVSQAATVFAAGSVTANGVTVTSETEGVELSAYVPVADATDDAAISDVNSSQKLDALKAYDELKSVVAYKELVSGGFIDVKMDKPNNGTKYTVTLNGLALSKMKASSVRVLHYVNGVWEVITPDKVDTKNGSVTVTFDSLSPVAVIAQHVTDSKHDGSGSSSSNSSSASATAADTAAAAAATVATVDGVATSPKTGVASDWAVWMMAAVVLLGIAGAASRKSRA